MTACISEECLLCILLRASGVVGELILSCAVSAFITVVSEYISNRSSITNLLQSCVSWPKVLHTRHCVLVKDWRILRIVLARFRMVHYAGRAILLLEWLPSWCITRVLASLYRSESIPLLNYFDFWISEGSWPSYK